MNKCLKTIITFIVSTNLIWTNCLYAGQTLAWRSLLGQPDSFRLLSNLLTLKSSLSLDDAGRLINDLRTLFAEVLGDEPDSISIAYSKVNEEAFVFNRSGVRHIYRDKHTKLPPDLYLPPDFNECGISVAVYPFSERIIGFILENDDFVVVSGLPDFSSIRATDDERDWVREYIAGKLKERGLYREGMDIGEQIGALPDGSFKDYLRKKWDFVNDKKPDARGVTTAEHAPVNREIMYRDGSPVCGWLKVCGVPGLCGYTDDFSDDVAIEAKNAIKIRDFIKQKGKGWRVEFGNKRKDFITWDGQDDRDSNLNSIILDNIRLLFKHLSEEELGGLINRLPREDIVIAIADQSRHWVINCRGDRFIGVNRWLLEKIKEVKDELSEEKEGDRKSKLENELEALQVYLQTYLYHELRHEAFIEEDEIVDELVYNARRLVRAKRMLEQEKKGENRQDVIRELGIELESLIDAIHAVLEHDLAYSGFMEDRDIWTALEKVAYIEFSEVDFSSLMEVIRACDLKIKEWVDSAIERRQNGFDARYFMRTKGVTKGESFLKTLTGLKVVEPDSLFYDAAAIVGVGGYLEHNELLVQDFQRNGDNRLGIGVFKEYEGVYEDLRELDREGTEQRYRGKISYLLYHTGLTRDIRIDEWRTWKAAKDRDRLVAKEHHLARRCIIKLIKFRARYRLDGSVFVPLEEPLEYKESGNHHVVLVSHLAGGDYSKAAIRRPELEFKTTGLVDTIAGGTKHKFEEFVEKACIERVDCGDLRFKDITKANMEKVRFNREVWPRVRMLSTFSGYLNKRPEEQFSDDDKELLNMLSSRYKKHREGEAVEISDIDTDKFDELYKKACMLLARLYGLGRIDRSVFNYKTEDMLCVLWDAFDFVSNLVAHPEGFEFTEPLLARGDEGEGLTKDELDAIRSLQKNLERNYEDLEIRDIASKETKEQVRLILSIYKKKIARHRKALNDILERYGTTIAPDGKSMELMMQTGGWAGAVWIAREYKRLFSGGKIQNTLELDSGLSVFYNALTMAGVERGCLTGLFDLIGEPAFEYFGENPNRMAGNVVNGESKRISPNHFQGMKDESFQLVVSLYRLQAIKSAQRLFDIFKNVNRLLPYGGQFVVTLPPTSRFSPDALPFIRDKMGFEAVFEPMVTRNVLSEDVRRRVQQEGGESAVKKLEEMTQKEFYIVVFKKIGQVEKGEEELKEKYLLEIESAIIRRAKRGLEERDTVSPPAGRTAELAIPGQGVGIAALESDGRAPSGTASSALELDLTQSRELRAQDKIRGLLKEQVSEKNKLEDYLTDSQKDEVKKALDYKGGHDDSVYEDMVKLIGELEALGLFIMDNEPEFLEKIERIKEQRKLREKLTREEQDRFDRVTQYKNTALNEDTMKEVILVYEALEKLKERQRGEEDSRAFIERNKGEFEARRRLIKKYQNVRGFDRGNLRRVLDAKVDKLDSRLMQMAKTIDESIARRMGNFKDLADFEEKMGILFRYMDVEFLFTPLETKSLTGFTYSDMDFLIEVKRIWEMEVIAEGTVFTKKDTSGVKRISQCIGLISEWLSAKKDRIRWDRGFAGLVSNKDEREYIDVLDRELVFRGFAEREGLREETRFLKLKPKIRGEEIKEKLIAEYDSLAEGESLVITMDFCCNYNTRFLSALGKMGFTVVKLAEVLLQFENIDGGERVGEEFLKRKLNKRAIIVKKKSERVAVKPEELTLTFAAEDSESYEGRVSKRISALQSFGVKEMEIHEMLSRGRVIELYPLWSAKNLEDKRWQGEFLRRKDVEREAMPYEKRINDEARRRQERDANLIRKKKEHSARITYTGIWDGQEEAVRDLAHILLMLVKNFNVPEIHEGARRRAFITKIKEDEMVNKHPVLKELKDKNEEEFINKIEELLLYKYYDVIFESAYRNIARRVISFSLFEYSSFSQYVTVDGRKRVLDFMGVVRDSGRTLLNYYEYGFGSDSSPFALSEEDRYREIAGNLFDVRYFSTEGFNEDRDCPEIMHSDECFASLFYLFSTASLLTQFSGVFGVEVFKSEDTFSRELENLRELISRIEEGNRMLDFYKKSEEIFIKGGKLVGLIRDIYKNKETACFENRYFVDFISFLEKIIEIRRVDYETADKSSDIVILLLGGFIKLFSEEMTLSEYEDLKAELNRMIEELKRLTEGREKPREVVAFEREIERVGPISADDFEGGLDSYGYYMYSDSGKNRMVKCVSQERDTINGGSSPREIPAKDFCEPARYLKGLRLYVLSDSERRVLDNLVKKVMSPPEGIDRKEYISEVVNYLRIRNTINRCLYLISSFHTEVWAEEDLMRIHEDLITIREEVMEYEPRIAVHKDDSKDYPVLVLLGEFYRLKQMIEEEKDKGRRFELQILSVRLHDAIISKMNKNISAEALAKLGNPYHEELIQGVYRYYGHLPDYIEYVTMKMLFNMDSISDDYGVLNFCNEIYIISKYYPEKIKDILECIADTIAALKKMEIRIEGKGIDIQRNIERFLSIIGRKEYAPRLADELRRLIDRSKGRRPIYWNELVELPTVNIGLDERGERVDEIRLLIVSNQAFRALRLSAINNVLVSTEEQGVGRGEGRRYRPEEFKEQIELIVNSISSPYELYACIKNLAMGERKKAVKKGSEISRHGTVHDIIMIHFAKKLIDFFKKERYDELADALTSTFRQFMYFTTPVDYAMYTENRFIGFIVSLFLSDDHMASSYAYLYLEHYISAKQEVFENDRYDESIYVLFNLLLGLLLKDGKPIDKVKLSRTLILFKLAVKYHPSINLKGQWQRCIDYYKSGRISKDTLLAIGRNARVDMMAAVEKMREEESGIDIEDFIRRHSLDNEEGEDIFVKAVEDYESGRDRGIAVIHPEGYGEYLQWLNGRILYVISGEEKESLHSFISRIGASRDRQGIDNCFEELTAYIKEENTVNRYLYSFFISFGKIWSGHHVEYINGKIDKLKEEVLKAEPRVGVYIKPHSEFDLMTLVTEFYRLKQMLESEIADEARAMAQIIASKINDSIRLICQFDVNLHIAQHGGPWFKELVKLPPWDFDNAERISCIMVEREVYEAVINEKGMDEIVCKRLGVFIKYNESQKDKMLNAIARAIIIIGMGEGMKDKIGVFLRKFGGYFPDLIEGLERKIRARGASVVSEAEIDDIGLVGEFKDKNMEFDPDNPASEDDRIIDRLIKTDQAFRVFRLVELNEYALGKEKEGPDLNIIKQCDYIMRYMQDPYELVLMVYSLTFENLETGFSVEVLFSIGEKIEEYIKVDKDRLTKALAGSYGYASVMNLVLGLIMSMSDTLRKFIIELFLSEDPMVSANGFRYLVYYLKKLGDQLERGSYEEGLNNIFDMLADKIFVNDPIDVPRAKQVLTLFLLAVVYNPWFNLERQWERIINYYKEGRIDRDRLMALGRNAICFIKDRCEELRGAGRGNLVDDFVSRCSITAQDGDNIFEKAIWEQDAKRLVSITEEVSRIEYKDVLIERLVKVIGKKDIKLTDIQKKRALDLKIRFTRLCGIDLAPKIAEIVDDILGPDFKGDSGTLVLAIEKEILSWLFVEEQIRGDSAHSISGLPAAGTEGLGAGERGQLESAV